MNTRYVSKIVAVVLFSLSTLLPAQVTLYGLTSLGGSHDSGTVFSFTSSGTEQIIADLDMTYAGVPEGSLLYASDGNFYAFSIFGGYADSCTIFNCSPAGLLRTVVNLDTGIGGIFANPLGNSLMQAMDGNLYGMTTDGGNGDAGVILKLSLSGSVSVLHTFSAAMGYAPHGGFTQTTDSLLWGMTSEGGTDLVGNIFHITPTGVFTTVYNFDTADGAVPYGDLLLATDGNFYGLTSRGGLHNRGTLFRFNPSGVYTKLYDFNDTDGSNPFGSLIQASDGNLYGLTCYGGQRESNSGYGTIFVCTLSGNLTSLMKFDSLNGAFPKGSLMQASDGNFYGMTYGGGQSGFGTIFQYTLPHSFTKLHDFDSASGDGYYPMYGKFIEPTNISTRINKLNKNAVEIEIYPNPNNGKFTLRQNGNKNNYSVLIYNILGDLVSSYANISTPEIAPDLSNEAQGIYFYKTVDEKGNLVSNGKFVIQR